MFDDYLYALDDDQLDGYRLSKGTVRFTVDRPVPADVVTEMVRRRLGELGGR